MRSDGLDGARVGVIMVDHYHLFIETSEANLVEGMKWLQNTPYESLQREAASVGDALWPPKNIGKISRSSKRRSRSLPVGEDPGGRTETRQS